MANWFIEQREFTPETLETISRELVAGPFESYEECDAYCVVMARRAVEEGCAWVAPKCYTGAGYRGNLVRLSPETERGHSDNVKRDRFNSSAKALATWAKKTGQAYCGFDDQWIIDILGEENGNEG